MLSCCTFWIKNNNYWMKSLLKKDPWPNGYSATPWNPKQTRNKFFFATYVSTNNKEFSHNL
jgi:hypothetical protein